MINISVDGSGAVNAVVELRRHLFEIETMGKILKSAVDVLWIPNILNRLEKSTSTSGYLFHLNKTMNELDPAFVARMSTDNWASQTEAERVIAGGYKKGEITDSIRSAIKASNPIKGDGFIAVGVADINLLNQLAGKIGKNSTVEIWKILQFGYGVESPYGGHVVQRVGNQVFFSESSKSGVATGRNGLTNNPGYKGREYFVQLDGSIHRADYGVKTAIISYMAKMVKKYSYK